MSAEAVQKVCGIDPRHLEQIETGNADPTTATILCLARVLAVPMSYVFPQYDRETSRLGSILLEAEAETQGRRLGLDKLERLARITTTTGMIAHEMLLASGAETGRPIPTAWFQVRAHLVSLAANAIITIAELDEREKIAPLEPLGIVDDRTDEERRADGDA